MNKNQETQATTRPISVLLIENDASVRQALGDALTAEKYCVVSVANGQEALLSLDKQPIDIVLVDLNPRNENPWETLQRLHSIKSGLPVIGMTARAEQQDPNASLIDIKALVEKPLNFPLLFQALTEMSSHTLELRESSLNF